LAVEIVAAAVQFGLAIWVLLKPFMD
jgi:hypothetical protein